ncbi:MAG TPA: tetratricopeptide repeat protein [Longimicrobiaceae bacterium]|nr:tetratricopeptide repeat protein [Longimicrobiaceae bacterium]
MTPLTVEEARSLRAKGEWQALVERAKPMSENELFADPELALLYAVGCRRVGDTGRALAVAGRVEGEARRRGDRVLVAETVNLIGNALFESGRMEEARARYEELLESASQWHDEEYSARASNNLGIIANVRGRRDQALVSYERALAAYQRLGNVRGLAETHHNLGISYRDLGFDREADAHFRRAIELAEGAGLQDVMALAETERAGLRARAGDGQLAAEMARRALERFRRIADPTGAASAIRSLAAAARVEGRDDDAAGHLDEALRIADAHADALIRAEVQRDRGLLLRDRGDTDAARAALEDAAAHFEKIGALAEAAAMRSITADFES